MNKVIKPLTKISLNEKYTAKAIEYDLSEEQQEEIFRNWATRLTKTKGKVKQVNEQYRKLIIQFLSEAYSVYKEIEDSNFQDEFYAELRFKLKEDGVKIQSNTPNAGLIVRYICGTGVSTKSVSDYSRVLEGARSNDIEPEDFEQWVHHKTLTKVIEAQRALESNKETYAQRLKRARLVVLRALQAQETRPIISQKTTAWHAERMLGQTGLFIAIGNATRRNDRESFYADINLLTLIGPDVDLEIYIVNHLAKPLVSNVEEYEKLMTTKEESIWADELWEQIVSAGQEESRKSNLWWSERQQAARFEDQSEFEAFRKLNRKKK